MCSFRVPDGMTPPHRTAHGWASQVSLTLDEGGAFGRECPNRECLAYFKLFLDEYAPVRDRRWLTCPVCGSVEDDEHFFTPDQLARAKAAATELARGAAERAIADVFGRGSRMGRTGRASVRFTLPSGAPRIPKPLPNYIERQTIRTFTCPNGGHRAVIYDLLAFCPYCGPDDTPPRAVFDDTLAAMQRLLALVEDQPTEAHETIAAAGGLTVLTERALTNAVAALQNIAKQIHHRADKPPPSDNPWQNIDRLQKQWLADFAIDPLDGLEPSQVRTLVLAFSRRHVLEHNGGICDARYVRATAEGTVGQKVRISPSFVSETFEVATVFADRLLIPPTE
jgi:hypothetical protein